MLSIKEIKFISTIIRIYENIKQYVIDLSPLYSETREAIVRPVTVNVENGDGMGNLVSLSIDALEYDGLFYVSIPALYNETQWFSYGSIIMDRAPKVIIDGRHLSFDVPSRIQNGRLLVPARAMFEAMGAVVDYDDKTQTVTATKNETTVVLTIGDLSPTINGNAVHLDQPGVITNGRALAPLRFVAEAFGGRVEWDAEIQTARLSLREPGFDSIIGTWEYTHSSKGKGDTLLILSDDENVPRNIEIHPDDTISGFSYEGHKKGRITRATQFSYSVTYYVLESEEYQNYDIYYIIDDALFYDLDSGLLRYAIGSSDVRHYYKRA